ncbi:MAG: hypothetical protein E7256_06765 [Lachnospiraceae bacterium]|nr:hypothetical protein [Lachnospiraceae bacterium]
MLGQPILQKKLKKDKQMLTQVIGVFGLHPFAGTSYVSNLLAEYLTGILGKRVLVVEAGGRDDFVKMTGSLKEECGETFTFRDITYVRNVEKDRIASWCNSPYDYCILELGSCYNAIRDELMLTDKKLLISHISPWSGCDERLLKELAEEIDDFRSWSLVLNLTDREKYRRYKRIVRKSAIPSCYLGFEPNVQKPSAAAIALFDRIIL